MTAIKFAGHVVGFTRRGAKKGHWGWSLNPTGPFVPAYHSERKAKEAAIAAHLDRAYALAIMASNNPTCAGIAGPPNHA